MHAYKKKKALFITHDISLYGASRSLQTLIRNLDDTEIDLVVRKRFFGKLNFEAIREFYGPKVGVIKEFHLPFDPCYVGKNASSLIFKLTKLLWQKNASSLYKFIRSGGYSYVHLNSLVLHPIIRPDIPFFIHIRDIYDHSNPAAIESLKNSTGVIYIDDTTHQPFAGKDFRNSTILNNPFDMRHLANIKGNQTTVQNPASKVIFSIIGKVVKVKGVDKVIEAFKRVKNPDAVLLVVGDGGDKSYFKHCQELAGEDKRIIFYGEEPNIEKIYAISDYILRADPQFCIGRTIYEGLYSGCKIIMPGLEKDKSKIFEIEKFSDAVLLYPANDVEALITCMKAVSQTKAINRIYSTNVLDYIYKFQNFIDRSVQTNLAVAVNERGRI